MSCSRCQQNSCSCQSSCPDNTPCRIAIYTQNSWNVPVDGGQAILNTPTLCSIGIGSSIWNATYGYFKVISFNSILSQIVVENDHASGNAAPGTAVPAYTQFEITTPLEIGPVKDFSSLITFGGIISMTYTVAPQNIYAKYVELGSNLIWFVVRAVGTTAGTPSYGLTHTLPVPALSMLGFGALNGLISGLSSSDLVVNGIPSLASSTELQIFNGDYSPLQIGANKSLVTGGIYIKA